MACFLLGFFTGVIAAYAALGVGLWVGLNEERPTFQEQFQDDDSAHSPPQKPTGQDET